MYLCCNRRAEVTAAAASWDIQIKEINHTSVLFWAQNHMGKIFTVKARADWSCVFPLCQLTQALMLPQPVRLVDYFLLRAGLIKNKVFWQISKLFFSPFLYGKQEGFSLIWKKLIQPLEVNLTKLQGGPLWPGPARAFRSQICPH